jgi:hypothetical protein
LINMKVIKEKSREYNGKPYYKYRINIPEKILKEANITETDQLEAKAKEDRIEIKKRSISN